MWGELAPPKAPQERLRHAGLGDGLAGRASPASVSALGDARRGRAGAGRGGGRRRRAAGRADPEADPGAVGGLGAGGGAGAPDAAGLGGGPGGVGVAGFLHLGRQAGLVEQVAGGLPRLAEDLGDQGQPQPPGPWASTATVSSTGAPAGRAAPPAGDWASTVPGAAASSTASRCTSDSPASS